MSAKDQLKKHIEEVLRALGIEGVSVAIDSPADPKNGEYATNVAMVAFGKAKGEGADIKEFRNPVELAVALKMKLDALDIPFLSHIEVVPPGFINFRISDSYLLLTLPSLAKGEWGIADSGKGRKVVVEYSSPNIAKPFTVGHLRSTIIGDAVANLLEATGWEVHRDNHVGDWGTQFGKQIYAIKKWGSESVLEKAERPVKLLVDLYVKFHEEAEKDPGLDDEARAWFKKLEEGDPEARDLWQKCVDWSWREFEGIYAKLGVKFTENNGRGYGESFFEGKMLPVIDRLQEKGLLEIGEEGARIVTFPEETKLPPLMILKKDGATLYATRDLATDKFRLENYGKDIIIINEVGVEQSLYFQQLYKLEEMLGWFKSSQRIHMKHGHFRFKEGKMSTRKGNVIWLEDVLEEAEKRAQELAVASNAMKKEGLNATSNVANANVDDYKDNDLAKIVGIGALKWNDLKRDSKQDIVFDWDDILTMHGNSGPYVQYAYARTQSVLRKSEIRNPKSLPADAAHQALQAGEINSKYKLESEERELLRLLMCFADVVTEAADRLSSNIICTYLFELAQAFNLFYQKHPILKAEGQAQALRILLTEATGSVLKEGLRLLGIQSPSRM